MTGYEMTNLADVLTRHARERPWAVAIIENDVVIHYRTLERLVWAAAWHLRRAGVAPGDVVSVALPHSALYLVALFALARIGAVSLAPPLGGPTPVATALIRRLAVKWAVAGSDGISVAGVPTIALTAEILQSAPVQDSEALRFVGGEHLCMIWRTSGTTSDAKAIGITHRGFLAQYAAQAKYFGGPGHRLLALMDFVTTVYGVLACLRSLFGGGAIVIPALPMNQQQFFDFIDRYGITRLALLPSMLGALLPQLPMGSCRCPGLEDVTVSGMAMPEALRAEVRRRFSRNLLVRYGSNETNVLTAADAELQEKYPETVGRALPGVELQVVDDEDRPVAAGEPGHIRARAPWMPKGYINAPEAANRTFRNGWVYPGDIGVLSAEGMLFIRGRSDDMMNFDGIKIMPADIEEALLAHPAVAEAVAFPLPSSGYQQLPAAAVVLRHLASADDLLMHCRTRLGARAPVAIMIETSLPRNAMGKVVRRHLAAKLTAAMPDVSS